MLKIKYVETESLKSYENNSKIHPDLQIDQIKKSIDEFGFFEPILIDEHNTVLSGHARLQALKELNQEKAPTISLEGLTDIQKEKVVIAANKIQENGNWDKDRVISGLEKILNSEPDAKLQNYGFSTEELSGLLGDENDFDFSDDTYVPESNEEYAYAIIQYVIIFDDEEQQRVWHQLLTTLKDKYPDLPTHSSRITEFINETT